MSGLETVFELGGDPRRLYPTDLSDAEWALLEPLLERHDGRGQPPRQPRQPAADAVLYLLRSGYPWRLPRARAPTLAERLHTVAALA